ncbi:hypothetical protein B0H14DRAFT_3448420 [Mycena olivaceomarginata]|nr:hypothetical protein B0H14DRAFT_3448420 [Mycena olivaceomarginata]
MRPAAKRPLSVAAAAPIKQSKKGRVALGDAAADSAPRVPSAARARGRGGARAVSPSQVRKQPARKAQEVQIQQRVQPKVKANTGALAGASPPAGSPSAKHATESSAVSVGFNFETGEREEEAEGTQPRAKGYSIPDFKAMHASQAAQNALRRSQFAPTVPVPIAFSTDARAKERERFDEKEREKEEAREIRELRRRAIPTAHEVPEWYKEAPRRQNGSGQ